MATITRTLITLPLQGVWQVRDRQTETERELSAPKTTNLKSHWCRDKSSTTFRLTTKEQEQYNF